MKPYIVTIGAPGRESVSKRSQFIPEDRLGQQCVKDSRLQRRCFQWKSHDIQEI